MFLWDPHGWRLDSVSPFLCFGKTFTGYIVLHWNQMAYIKYMFYGISNQGKQL